LEANPNALMQIDIPGGRLEVPTHG
jgi:hypothetical protein